jgi:hypothetical protein
MIARTLVNLISIALAVLFAYAAVDKLEHYALFSLQLQQFPFSIPVVHRQAWAVPVMELIISFLLLLPVTRLKGLFASLFLLSLYTLYLTGMLDSRFYCSCNCGEPFQSLSLKMHIACTLVCVLFTGVGVVLFGRLMSPSLRELEKFPLVRPYYKQTDTSLIESKN